MQTHGYAALGAAEPLQPFTYELKELGPNEARVAVTHCGLCYSDVDAIDNTHGFTAYPLVPGHEIVGVVSEVGAGVSHLAVGQRVGIGPLCGSCHHCEYCASSRENLCSKMQLTIAGGNHGGLAATVQVDAGFAFPLPDGLESAKAAPLLCAGLTVFSPLRAHTRPGMRVGVIGIGGLGHLAIQLANKLGTEVTAFSRSPDKEEEARKFGAHRFIVTTDSDQMSAAASSIDFILSTVYAPVPWAGYLPILRPDGKICTVGASMSPIDIPAALLIMRQTTFFGSAAGGRHSMMEMLELAARHGIEAQTELMPMSQANEALDKVRRNKARYRIVLAAKSSQ